MAGNFKTVESIFGRFGSLINTCLIIISACAFVYAWGQYDAGVRNDIKNLNDTVARNAEDVDTYITDHEAMVKERFGENRAVVAATDSRLRAIEKSLEESNRKNDRLEYRVTVAESELATQTANQKAVTEKLNDLIGDVRVIKEVVVRAEANSKTARKELP